MPPQKQKSWWITSSLLQSPQDPFIHYNKIPKPPYWRFFWIVIRNFLTKHLLQVWMDLTWKRWHSLIMIIAFHCWLFVLGVSLWKQMMFLDFKCVFNEEVQLQILNMLTFGRCYCFSSELHHSFHNGWPSFIARKTGVILSDY